MSTLQIVLTTSIFVVLIIGFTIFFVLKYKANKVKKEYIDQMKKFENPEPIKIDNIFNELISDSDWHNEDFEFILNTIKINNYKKTFFWGKKLYSFLVNNFHNPNLENYYCDNKLTSFDKEEFSSIALKTNQKIETKQNILFDNLKEHNFDFIYIDFYDENQNLFQSFYEKLNKKGMLVFKDKFSKKESLKISKKLTELKIKYQFYKNGNYYLLVIAKI
ncbi:BC85_0335 family putative methyltransferase [[Mycoplasma] collis]|uniref:BC85_0335 family putative methyltransferase n=1 Tax=[Mycoplasma] collis TaxID=2127 RepID=UPI00051AD316|nr:hypothetical protein [[Mycoplasma] collis]